MVDISDYSEIHCGIDYNRVVYETTVLSDFIINDI